VIHGVLSLDHPVHCVDPASRPPGRLRQAAPVPDQPRPPRAPVSGVDDGGGILQRHADVPQRGQGLRPRQLAQPVAAVAGAIIDLGRHEQADLVIVPQRLHRQPRQLGERANTDQLA
jgi:hypothetical protein